MQPAAAASTAAAGSGFGAKGAVAQPAAQQVLQGDNVLDLLGHCRMLLVVLRGLCATDRGTSPMCYVPVELLPNEFVRVRRCSSRALSVSLNRDTTRLRDAARPLRRMAPVAHRRPAAPALLQASPHPPTRTPQERFANCVCASRNIEGVP